MPKSFGGLAGRKSEPPWSLGVFDDDDGFDDVPDAGEPDADPPLSAKAVVSATAAPADTAAATIRPRRAFPREFAMLLPAPLLVMSRARPVPARGMSAQKQRRHHLYPFPL